MVNGLRTRYQRKIGLTGVDLIGVERIGAAVTAPQRHPAVITADRPAADSFDRLAFGLGHRFTVNAEFGVLERYSLAPCGLSNPDRIAGIGIEAAGFSFAPFVGDPTEDRAEVLGIQECRPGKTGTVPFSHKHDQVGDEIVVTGREPAFDKDFPREPALSADS